MLTFPPCFQLPLARSVYLVILRCLWLIQVEMRMPLLKRCWIQTVILKLSGKILLVTFMDNWVGLISVDFQLFISPI